MSSYFQPFIVNEQAGPAFAPGGTYPEITVLSAQGSFGRLAILRHEGAEYALKFSTCTDIEDAQRFQRAGERIQAEYDTLVRLDGASGHAPRAYAFGVFHEDHVGTHYAMVEDYVSGVGFQNAVPQLTGSPWDRIVPAGKVLSAARGIVGALLSCTVESKDDPRYRVTVSHRDLNWGNVRFSVTDDGEVDQVVLLDFGQSVDADNPDVTEPGPGERSAALSIGSPETYSLSKNAAWARSNTDSSDVYSIGAILHFLRTGRYPLEAEIEQIRQETIDRVGFMTLDATARQKVFDAKNRGPIDLEGALAELEASGVDAKRTPEDDQLRHIIAICTEPGLYPKHPCRASLRQLAAILDVQNPSLTEGWNQGIESMTQAQRTEAARAASANDAASKPPTAAAAAAAATPTPATRKPKRLIAIAALALALIAVVGAVFMFGGKATHGSDADYRYHARLYPNTSLPASAYDSTFEKMQQRMETFAPNGDYALEKTQDYVDVRMNDEDMNDRLFECLCSYYLGRPMELCLVDKSKMGWMTSVPKTPINRTEITSAEVCDVPEDYEPADFFKGAWEGEDPDEASCVKVSLTEAAAKKLAKKYTPNDTVASTDANNDGCPLFDVRLDEQDHCLYIVNTPYALSKREVDLLTLALNDDAYQGSFTYECLPNAEWGEDQAQGENQVDPSKLDSNTCTYQVKLLTVPAEGERLDLTNAIAKRLDATGFPYAMGSTVTTHENGDYQYYLEFRLSRAHMGKRFANAIVASELELNAGYESLILYAHSFQFQAKGEKVLVSSGSSSYNKDQLDNLVASAKKSKSKIYLSTRDMTACLFSADASDYKDGVLTMTSEVTGTAVEDGGEWVANTVAAIGSTELPSGIYPEIDNVIADDYAAAKQSGPGVSCSAGTTELEATVHDVCPEAVVNYDEGKAQIHLKLPIDDKLPKASTEMVKEILKSYDFADAPFKTLVFYLSEDESTVERTRIFVNKYKRIGDKPGYIYISGIFCGGRADDYQADFKHIVETDDFYVKHSSKDFGWTWKW